MANIGGIPGGGWVFDEIFNPVIGPDDYALAATSENESPHVEDGGDCHQIQLSLTGIAQATQQLVEDIAVEIFTMIYEIGAWLYDTFITYPVFLYNTYSDDSLSETLFYECGFFEKLAIIFDLFSFPEDQRAQIIQDTLPLLQPHMTGLDRLGILNAVSKLAPADKVEVLEVVRERMTQYEQPTDYEICELIREVTNLPAGQRSHDQAEINAANGGVGVHAEGRDRRCSRAVQLLIAHQGDISQAQVNEAYDAFKAFLQTPAVSTEHAELAEYALEADTNHAYGYDFGPFIRSYVGWGGQIQYHQNDINGFGYNSRELIARLWRFAEAQSAPDDLNAKLGMVAALVESFDTGRARFCNPGKLQRLTRAVLQGRLEGAIIDLDLANPPPLNGHQALNIFFQLENNQQITERDALRTAGEAFCDDSPNVVRDDFMLRLNAYAQLMGIE